MSWLSELLQRPAVTWWDLLDIAIVYGLLNVIGTIAVLKFFRYGDLGEPGSGREGEEH